MDVTVVLGFQKFSLQAAIDHHIICVFWSLYNLYQLLKKIYCNDSKIMEFEIIDTKNSSNAYIVRYNLFT